MTSRHMDRVRSPAATMRIAQRPRQSAERPARGRKITFGRVLSIVGMWAIVAVTLGTIAVADPPAGNMLTCPTRYESITLEQLLAQAQRNGVSEDKASQMFEFVNKNDDSWICQEKLPGENHYNFVDNQALGRG